MTGINLSGGQHLLRALQFESRQFYSVLEQQQQQLGILRQLQDSFGLAAGFMTGNALGGLLGGGAIPAAGLVAPPIMAGCRCPHAYAPGQVDFGRAPGVHPRSLPGIMNRQRGAMYESFLNANPFARAQVEMMMGGRLLRDGRADGKMRFAPFPPGAFPAGGVANAAAITAMGTMHGLMHGAAMAGLSGAHPFMGMMAGGLSRLVSGRSPFVSRSHQPGRNHPAQGSFGLGDGADASGILNDPSLTVEDKVSLMIMLIMKKMDKDIEKQANYINDLQQQQNKGGKGKGGKGGKGKGGIGKGGIGKGGIGKGGKGKGGGGNSPSIDVETMKLKRLIDKRSQMFDMLRQIIDKYNQTAKGIIDSIGR